MNTPRHKADKPLTGLDYAVAALVVIVAVAAVVIVCIARGGV